MERHDLDKRDGVVYDPIIKGLDANFWATITGTVTYTSNILRFTSASAASFLLYEFGQRYNFKLNIATAPTAGQTRRWGLYSPAASADFGAIYFDVNGTAFTVNVIDDAGNLQSKTITWQSAWTGNAIVYGFTWEPQVVQFWINGAIVATFTSGSGTDNVPEACALPLYIDNGVADNMDLSYLLVKKAAGIV